jgi:hypothetical protein
MKCEDCLAILEEYFDSELNGRESKKVAGHLASCVICNEVYESLQQEQQLYAHYERDVEVTSALWQGVQAKIKQESVGQEVTQPISVAERLRRFFTETFHAPRFSPALAAMLVVIAVGATVLVMNYVNSHSDRSTAADGRSNSNGTFPNDANANNSQQSGTPQVADKGNNNAPENKDNPVPVPEKKQDIDNPNNIKTVASNISSEATTPRRMPVEKASAIQPNATAEALLRDAEKKYIAAIAILQRDFDKRRSKLDPQLVAKLEASLASIDSTIAETRKAVRLNFDDPVAVQYMLTAYAKKVEILRDVTAN